MSRLARFAWTVLIYNLGVIAWGAYVRATGSGAGCGNHWPLCNGAVVPRADTVQLIVEFSHRLTSGLALVSVVALFIWARRVSRPGDPTRIGATLSLAFMISEALLGALLVKFQLVAGDASAARAVAVGAHLLNTFLLLGSLTLSVYGASGGRALRTGGRGVTMLKLVSGAIALLERSPRSAIRSSPAGHCRPDSRPIWRQPPIS